MVDLSPLQPRKRGRPPKISYKDVIDAIKKGLTRKEFAMTKHCTYPTINNTINRLKINYPKSTTSQRRATQPQNEQQSKQRDAEVAELYRSGMTLKGIAGKYNFSVERARQLISRYEQQNNVKVDRLVVPKRVIWKCLGCGRERTIVPSLAYIKMCHNCHYISLRNIPQTLELIEQRMKGITWQELAIKYNKRRWSDLAVSVYSYMRLHNNIEEIQKVFAGYSTRWISTHFPNDDLDFGIKQDGRLRRDDSSFQNAKG